MKTKLHFGILIILMAFLGRYLESSVVHNQQIVVQFSDLQITESESQKTIEAIQLKLQTIGVKDIQVGQDQNGQLKITYYSETDIQYIKGVLSDDESIEFAYNANGDHSDEFPEQQSTKDYELNISEINNTNTWNFETVEIVDLNHKSDRFSNLNDYNTNAQINLKSLGNLIKVCVAYNNSIALAIDNQSYKIPEVRAGPTT
ncbi:hypothetical protein [Winogradskyella luteola]|uniref:Uncharacterized protein n=1 Tax=Winogradskyella luteola TaxID=2828330 RepID=A0A9X1FC02_9FLAO|nr:hypothetical protein [Winogradskyella luteola]MBV7269960.1 hypothetical protein [Winogradskyella luteola]